MNYSGYNAVIERLYMSLYLFVPIGNLGCRAASDTFVYITYKYKRCSEEM